MKYISVITFLLFLTPLYTGVSEFINTIDLPLYEDPNFNAFYFFEADGALIKPLNFTIKTYLLFGSLDQDLLK